MTGTDAQRMAALEASHRELKTALEFYSKPHVYVKIDGKHQEVLTDRGWVARTALAAARALQQPSQGESEE